jgi:hypothetical protein
VTEEPLRIAAAAAARERTTKTPGYFIGARVLAAVIAAATRRTPQARQGICREDTSEYRAPQRASRDLFDSLANGSQPYQNPDRQLYLPD